MENKVSVIKKKRNNRKSNSFYVDDEYLLYYLSDLGLLRHLKGVHKHKTDKDRRVWFFDKVPDVKEAIERFREEEEKRESSYR